jgi:hypothetical protein
MDRAGRRSAMAKCRAEKRRFFDSKTESVAPSRRPASVTPAGRKVQVAAAKTRMTLDRLTGDDTPEWIIALSTEKPE